MKKAFTLAEVLITLGIIGVVAAMTLPTVIKKYQEKETVTRLKTVYSIFSQAVKLAETNAGPIESWGWNGTVQGSNKILDVITPYMKIDKVCYEKAGEGCFSNKKYKTLDASNASNLDYNQSASKARLSNGMSFYLIDTAGNSTEPCSNVLGASKHLSSICGTIWVDINGNKEPNRYGHDFFSFRISKYGVIPAGTSDMAPELNSSLENDCKNITKKGHYGACTAWVLVNENLDYLRRDVSWDE